MTRKKIKLAFIANDSSRKATFKKRKKGLMKKVSELSTLCGVEACAIIYSSYDPKPEVWPSTAGAQQVVAQFKRMPEMEQSKKMVNQESFIRQRIAKASEQLKRQVKENREKEMTEVMFQCLTGKASVQGLNLVDVNDLGWVLEQNLKEIYKGIETLKKTTHQAAAAASSMQKPQWFPEEKMGNNNGDEAAQMGYGNAGEEMMMMMMPFNDNQNTMWGAAGSFFP